MRQYFACHKDSQQGPYKKFRFKLTKQKNQGIKYNKSREAFSTREIFAKIRVLFIMVRQNRLSQRNSLCWVLGTFQEQAHTFFVCVPPTVRGTLAPFYIRGMKKGDIVAVEIKPAVRFCNLQKGKILRNFIQFSAK